MESRRMDFDAVLDKVNTEEVRGTAMHCVYTTILYPLDYARTLIQIGYEPFPPTETKFFGTTYLALPNQFSYMKYIKSVDGFFGCYRGLVPRICQSIVSQTVYKRIACRNPFFGEGESKTPEEASRGEALRLSRTRSGALIRGSQTSDDFESMARHTGWEILSVTASTLASQPFYVISVRCMAQFVGRETKYSNMLDAIRTIYSEEGIAGFFKGLIPRIVADVVFISLSASLVYVCASYFGRKQPIESVTVMAANTVASSFSYQFHVVASTMAVNQGGLVVSDFPFSRKYEDFAWGWYECWKNLKAEKQLKRGSSLVGRYYTGPSIIVQGTRRPTGFYFGPAHPRGLGLREGRSIVFPSSK